MKVILLALLLYPLLSFSLEVDEKLTVRLIKISDSKKTVMINRGTEDGLVEGDHAKFIVTAGIVARGVVVKVSPTRSIWSIYRLVNADFIVGDSVMSIKITTPVKITKDETQALVQDDTPTNASGDPTNLGIPLAEGASDLLTSDSASSDADLRALQNADVPLSIVEKDVELYGIFNISGLSANTKTDNGNQSFTNSQSFHHIGLGGEYYARKEREWYSKFSLLAEVALLRQDSQAYNGASVANDLTEFSLGLNWHPTKFPSLTNAFIPYLHFSLKSGMVKSSYTTGTNAGTPELEATGTSSGFSVGGGFKFYTHKGFGARFILDYYLRTEKYKEDIFPNIHNKSLKGPRLLMGLSYRF